MPPSTAKTAFAIPPPADIDLFVAVSWTFRGTRPMYSVPMGRAQKYLYPRNGIATSPLLFPLICACGQEWQTGSEIEYLPCRLPLRLENTFSLVQEKSTATSIFLIAELVFLPAGFIL